MAVHYLSVEYTPTWRFRQVDSATTAVAAWTPTSSTKIGLTDITVATANSGTIQFRFGNVGGRVFAEFIVAGSVTAGRSYETPILNDFSDQAIFMEAGMGGHVSATLNGFEVEA